jgi:hypothetical protein
MSETLDPTTVHLNDTPAGSQPDHSAVAAAALPWLAPYWRAFGPRGLVALAHWTGSLMAQQLRARQRAFPILVLVGEEDGHAAPLLETLHALIGLPGYEGWVPAMATRQAQAQRLYGAENRPVVCLSLRGTRVRGLIREEVAAAYNGTPVCVRSTVLDRAPVTHRFAGGLVLSQLASEMGTPAMAMRCCELTLQRATDTGDSRAAVRELERMQYTLGTQAPDFIGFFDACHGELLDLHARLAPAHYERLLPVSHHPRVARNHAQLAALVDVLHVALQLSEEQHLTAIAEVASMAFQAGSALTVPLASLQQPGNA